MAHKRSQKVLMFPRRAKHARHAPWRAAIAALDARVSGIERRLAGRDRDALAHGARGRFRNALLLSVVAHLFVIYGIAFKIPDRSQF